MNCYAKLSVDGAGDLFDLSAGGIAVAPGRLRLSPPRGAHAGSRLDAAGLSGRGVLRELSYGR